jgi:hypothetical protein
MFKISHRGNLRGPDSSLENKPEHVASLVQQGYQVEVDVRTSPDGRLLFLGHDEPQYAIPESFLQLPGLWCHAKDYGALQRLASLNVHYFWHDIEDLVLTSHRVPWVHPRMELERFPLELIKRSVLVLPEKSPTNKDYVKRCCAVCTDYVLE